MSSLTVQNNSRTFRSKFTLGDAVTARVAGLPSRLTVVKIEHNGFSWMYSFAETGKRVAERFLAPAPEETSNA